MKVITGFIERTRTARRQLGQDPLFPVVYAIFVIALLGFLLAVFIYTDYFGPAVSSEQEVWGQFGDFVGGTLNPFFSFLSLVLFVISLMHQRLELKEARAQMAEQAQAGASAARLNALSTALEATNAMIATPLNAGERDIFLHLTAKRRREAILREILTIVHVEVPLDDVTGDHQDGHPS